MTWYCQMYIQRGPKSTIIKVSTGVFRWISGGISLDIDEVNDMDFAVGYYIGYQEIRFMVQLMDLPVI